MKLPTMNKPTAKGFTLIELAVALTIVAFIIGGMAIPLATRVNEQRQAETQASIDTAIEALVGFAILNRRLPCPDMRTLNPDDRDGFEDALPLPVGGVQGLVTGCATGLGGTNADPLTVSWGDLPWRTLGLQAPNNADAWNNRLRYAVFTPLVTEVPNPAFTCPPVGGITPPAVSGFGNIGCTPPSGGAFQLDIRCASTVTTPGNQAPGCIYQSATSAINYQVSTRAVFVVYSHGANGLGATGINDLSVFKTATIANAGADELANLPEGEASSALRRQFVSRAVSTESSLSGQYDDILSFMSSNTLAAKLLNAGVWP